MERPFFLHSIFGYGLVSSFVLSSFCLITNGQNAETSKPPELSHGPEAFENWLEITKTQLWTAKLKPTILSDAVLSRLKEGVYVTDKAVLTCVAAWAGYEGGKAQREPGDKKSRYDQTIATIDQILAQLYSRPLLAAKLQIRKAACYGIEEKIEDAVLVRRAANSELQLLYDEITLDYFSNLTDLGGKLYAQGKKKEAEAVFLDVLSMSWILNRPPVRGELQDRYLQAGRGLIDCRRNNLKDLKNTFFFPSTLKELGPVLNRALIEAGGKPRKLEADLIERMEEPFIEK